MSKNIPDAQQGTQAILSSTSEASCLQDGLTENTENIKEAESTDEDSEVNNISESTEYMRNFFYSASDNLRNAIVL